MLRARHRAMARHAGSRRPTRIPGLLAAATTATAVAVMGGVAVTGSDAVSTAVDTAGSAQLGAAAGSVPTIDLGVQSARGQRELNLSRSGRRVTLKPQAVDHRFATRPLDVWTAPRHHGKRVGQYRWAEKVAVTGQTAGRWVEVLINGRLVFWVNGDHLAARKPRPEPEPAPQPTPEPSEQSSQASSTTQSEAAGGGSSPATGISAAACPDGSAVESGITSSAVRLYRAVCAAFPALTTYGGYDAHGEHADGRAIDFMVSGPAGQAIADWVRAHAGALNVRDIIWAQHIWTPERSSEGWRFMEDRGSTTANHYDHVHVAVY